jgi:hypothetical protein
MPFDDDYYDDEDDYYGDIHDAGYRPPLNFKGDRSSETMMGFELEIEGCRDRIARAVHRIDSDEDHLYMKRDCSVDGVEIVTHPMTLAFARDYPFGELLARLRKAGCHDPANTGLHIHVDREAFRKSPTPPKVDRYGQRRPHNGSATHQMMWLLFIFRNPEPLIALGRRNSSWGTFCKPNRGELASKAKANGAHYGERYQAVNTNNEHTYELRFMKSTLDEQELYAMLEFADASVRYTRSLSANDVLHGKALTWRHFTDWAMRHNYKQLYQEITK